MSHVATLALAAAVAVAGLGIVPPAAAQSKAGAPVKVMPKTKAVPRRPSAVHRGRLLDAAPQAPARSPDDPSATGGGSLGYNQMIYNW